MTKTQLIAAVSDRTGMTRASVEKAVTALTDSITEGLVSGEKVGLVGFGSFAVSDRAARTGRNPKTGEPIQIAASKGVRFSAGTALKKALN
ncbi:MAG: HU family DNA-binding protein [Myxococcota bacterium]|jgi:DNA-binding protein HU-beta|nr:HU family DNA-binding protein [Myxococcota bacterium]